MITKEELEDALKEVKERAGLDEVALVTRDGLLIASSTSQQGFHEEVFAAMSATMLASAETAMEEMQKGVPRRVVVESEMAKLVAVGAGEKALLVGVAPARVGLGLVIVEIERAARRLGELL